MDNPKTLSEALCRIHKEAGVEVLQDPDRLPAFFVDIAPNLQAEQAQIDALIKTGCLKKLAVAAGLKAEAVKPIVATAVDTLCRFYLMDAKKATDLCNTYVKALSGKTYTPKSGSGQSNGNVGKAGGSVSAGKSITPSSSEGEKSSTQFKLEIQDVRTEGQAVVVSGPATAGGVHIGDIVKVAKKDGQNIFAKVSEINWHPVTHKLSLTLTKVHIQDVEPGGIVEVAFHSSGSSDTPNGNGGKSNGNGGKSNGNGGKSNGNGGKSNGNGGKSNGNGGKSNGNGGKSNGNGGKSNGNGSNRKKTVTQPVQPASGIGCGTAVFIIIGILALVVYLVSSLS